MLGLEDGPEGGQTRRTLVRRSIWARSGAFAEASRGKPIASGDDRRSKADMLRTFITNDCWTNMLLSKIWQLIRKVRNDAQPRAGNRLNIYRDSTLSTVLHSSGESSIPLTSQDRIRIMATRQFECDPRDMQHCDVRPRVSCGQCHGNEENGLMEIRLMCGFACVTELLLLGSRGSNAFTIVLCDFDATDPFTRWMTLEEVAYRVLSRKAASDAYGNRCNEPWTIFTEL